jgi:hypothetical protein
MRVLCNAVQRHTLQHYDVQCCAGSSHVLAVVCELVLVRAVAIIHAMLVQLYRYMWLLEQYMPQV